MEKYLADSSWTRPTPIGGRYMWAANTPHQGERYRAVIVITSAPGDPVSDNPAQLLALDRLVDDGNLRQGKLRVGFRDEPIFILEP
jgi:hypothetical protein